MYNRYIPQPDGSYRRSQYTDTPKTPPQAAHHQQERSSAGTTVPCPSPEPESACKTPEKECDAPRRRPVRHQRHVPSQMRKSKPCKSPSQSSTGVSGSGFLRQLLPADLDTGDLLVIVLLLLMAGDCPEDKENALLTLALYLFL